MKQPEQIELSANSHQKTIFATVIEVSLGKRMPGGDPTIMFCFIIIIIVLIFRLFVFSCVLAIFVT